MTELRIRIRPSERAIVERAAELLSSTVAEYVRHVLLRDARRVVADGAASREESER